MKFCGKNQDLKEWGGEEYKVVGNFIHPCMKDEKSVRNDRNFTVIEANKSGIKFRNRKLEDLNDDHSGVSQRYETQQSAIVSEMLGIASGYSDIMNHLGLLVSKLDVIVSLSLAAVSAPTQFVKPEVLPSTSRSDKVLYNQG